MLRERITITLEPDLIQAIDSLVDHDTLRNRSHAIEHLVREGLGLHRLRSAFLFFEEELNQERLTSLLSLCQAAAVRELFLCLSSQAGQLAADLTGIIASYSSDFSTQLLPAEFGSGGAVALRKDTLEHPFLLAWVGATLQLPPTLAQPYAFHRQHHQPLTELLVSETGGYRPAGLFIAEPELASLVPPGAVSLTDTVFAQLRKDGRVRGYILPS